MALLVRSLRFGLIALVLGGCTTLRSSGERTDGAVCIVDCECTPRLDTKHAAIVAHGARLSLGGTCLGEVDFVSIGAVAATAMRVGGRLEIDRVSDATPVGVAREILVRSPSGADSSRSITVIHLVVNEVDSNTGQGNQDNREFVEIATGVSASVDLAGYALLFLDGTTDATYTNLSSMLLGTTNPSGYYVLGNSGVTGVGATFPSHSLGEGSGAHGAAIVQTTSIPARGAPFADLTGRILDAVVFSGANAPEDAALLAWCFAGMPERVQADESSGGPPATRSIRRCGGARRDGRAFGSAAPSPEAANPCP